jgi:hypothetical protein
VLRREYSEKLASGEIKNPTRNQELICQANGHDDNESTQAARRLLSKKGIDWTPKTTTPQATAPSVTEKPNKPKPRGANLSKMARAGIMILGWFLTHELFNAAGRGKVRDFLSQGLKMAWNFEQLTAKDFARFFAVCDDDTKREKVAALYHTVMGRPVPIAVCDKRSAPIECGNNYGTMPPPKHRHETRHAMP